MVVNPRREPATVVLAEVARAEPLWGSGVRMSDQRLEIDGFGYGILVFD